LFDCLSAEIERWQGDEGRDGEGPCSSEFLRSLVGPMGERSTSGLLSAATVVSMVGSDIVLGLVFVGDEAAMVMG